MIGFVPGPVIVQTGHASTWPVLFTVAVASTVDVVSLIGSSGSVKNPTASSTPNASTIESTS
ncbi:hypothetical protein D3C83_292430 [compost metagenome]